MEYIIQSNQEIIKELITVIEQFSCEDYKKKLSILNNSSIGMHARHILDFYNCLLNSNHSNYICYDERKREVIFEIEPLSLIIEFEKIIIKLSKITSDYNLIINNTAKVNSTLLRELLYVMDHSIHHMALIKVGINVNFPQIHLNENFGISSSTIKFTNKKNRNK